MDEISSILPKGQYKVLPKFEGITPALILLSCESIKGRLQPKLALPYLNKKLV